MTDIKILNLSEEMQSEALLIPKLCRIEKKHFFESKNEVWRSSLDFFTKISNRIFKKTVWPTLTLGGTLFLI